MALPFNVLTGVYVSKALFGLSFKIFAPFPRQVTIRRINLGASKSS